MSAKTKSVAVIGGGPAGLRAAEVAAAAGASVSLYEWKPSAGRKFLVAGKSGLNLTNDADPETFLAQYSGKNFPRSRWQSYLHQFDAQALREWSASLGIDTFVAGGGKVFPESKKAAPLLRRWLQRLKANGVQTHMHHRWLDFNHTASGIELKFSFKGEVVHYHHDTVILALGGASWPQTGSDGKWSEILSAHSVGLEPLRAANCGWECHWSSGTLVRAEGQPLHHLSLRAGGVAAAGELMVTRYGFEGTPIYRLGRTLHTMKTPSLEIDFKPVFSVEYMVKKMESARRDFFKEARLRWKLTDAMCAIIEQHYGQFDSAQKLAEATKCCRIPLTGPRPMAEAISSSGGIAWTELDASLMLKQFPGIYCAGEMIDWEAPTGGYLIQGCFATGTIAGHAAAATSA
ncbi:MAG: putative flavoprotein (TIGR03862 family) [Lentimonas sp.]|jgi:uncharacterized flavoprotein (TIGR03862 family)